MVASEVAPFAKTGGLADVLGSLPAALQAAGADVHVLMPEYRRIANEYGKRMEFVGTVTVPIGKQVETGSIRRFTTAEGVTVYFLGHEHYYHRAELYGGPAGDYPDNDERFIFLCRGALEALRLLSWRPDIIHCHDWQTGLIPVYLRRLYEKDTLYRRMRSVLTIHNLCYQGRFPASRFKNTTLPWSEFTPATLEYYGDVNFLKGGLVYADAITTVSPTYAREILKPEHGCGLQGVLQTRAHDLHGILNGLDPDIWDPRKDPLIPANYSAKTVQRKAANKQALKRSAGLYFPDISAIPLVGMIARLVEQKGVDLLLERIDDILHLDLQLIVFGTGDERYRKALTAAARKYPGKLSVETYFSDPRARLIYAGSDLFLMPSRYEPCGLGQLIAMRYGTVPIVHRTGGLADTVTDFNPSTGAGSGIVFADYTADALLTAVTRGMTYYQDRKLWRTLTSAVMRQEFSWRRSVRDYLRLYRQMCRSSGRLPLRRPAPPSVTSEAAA